MPQNDRQHPRRALDGDGFVIPGLYAAGSSTGGLEGGPNVGYVGGIVKAFVLGLRAGEAAAKDIGKQQSVRGGLT